MKAKKVQIQRDYKAECAAWRLAADAKIAKLERELSDARKDIADITEVWGRQITDYLEARRVARESAEGSTGKG